MSIGCSAESAAGGNQSYSYPTASPYGGDSSFTGALVDPDPDTGVRSDPEYIVLPAKNDLVGDTACATFSTKARQVEIEVPFEVEVEVVEAKPVAIYLMLDQSTSMYEASNINIKWFVAVDAINAFVSDPASSNIDIGLQYFPLLLGDCATGLGYDTPEVRLCRLPENATNISNSLLFHLPGIGGAYTPIEGALRGLTQFCIRYKQDRNINPDNEECVGVLVTDGMPTTCNGDHNSLVGMVADAQTQHGIRTFTIGMTGADFDLLNKIARAGNGDCTPDPADPSWACDVGSGDSSFIEVLNRIRGSVTTLQTITEFRTEYRTEKLVCEWNVPEPPNGETFDKNMVNVRFSSTDNNRLDEQLFSRVDSRSNCGAASSSWYYDDMDAPTKIIACPATCEKIEASDTGSIDIVFGCQTVIL